MDRENDGDRARWKKKWRISRDAGTARESCEALSIISFDYKGIFKPILLFNFIIQDGRILQKLKRRHCKNSLLQLYEKINLRNHFETHLLYVEGESQEAGDFFLVFRQKSAELVENYLLLEFLFWFRASSTLSIFFNIKVLDSKR